MNEWYDFMLLLNISILNMVNESMLMKNNIE